MNDSEKRLIVFAIIGAGIVFMIPSVDAKKSRNSDVVPLSYFAGYNATTYMSCVNQMNLAFHNITNPAAVAETIANQCKNRQSDYGKLQPCFHENAPFTNFTTYLRTIAKGCPIHVLKETPNYVNLTYTSSDAILNPYGPGTPVGVLLLNQNIDWVLTSHTIGTPIFEDVLGPSNTTIADIDCIRGC